MVAGKLCADDIDECALYPTRCRNGATCENTDGSYLCHCRHGYRGRFCDVNPDDCLPGALSFHYFIGCLWLEFLLTYYRQGLQKVTLSDLFFTA